MKWVWNIWKSGGFAFLFHYEGNWNQGTERRLYILWWEFNFRYVPTTKAEDRDKKIKQILK